jgi:hypothetical protein
MFVSPNAEASTGVSEQSLVREELLGSYRRTLAGIADFRRSGA